MSLIADAEIDETSTVFFLDCSPAFNMMSLLCTPKTAARKRTTSLLAFPSTGGDDTAIFNRPSWRPTILVFDPFGWTCRYSFSPPSDAGTRYGIELLYHLRVDGKTPEKTYASSVSGISMLSKRSERSSLL